MHPQTAPPVFCAHEWQDCECYGVISYGIGSVWIQKTVSGRVKCTNDFFENDPYPGRFKQCMCAVSNVLADNDASRITSLSSTSRTLQQPLREEGYCVSRSGHDVNSGVIKNRIQDLSTISCLEWCLTVPAATACEFIINQGNRGCYAHTSALVDHGNGAANHWCWVLETSDFLLSSTIATKPTLTSSQNDVVVMDESTKSWRRSTTALASMRQRGFCVSRTNEDVNDGLIKHPDRTLSFAQCVRWCASIPDTTGCERIAGQANRGCYAFTNHAIHHGNGAIRHWCWVFPRVPTHPPIPPPSHELIQNYSATYPEAASLCAAEGGFCRCNGKLWYGAPGEYYTRRALGIGLRCDAASFQANMLATVSRGSARCYCETEPGAPTSAPSVSPSPEPQCIDLQPTRDQGNPTCSFQLANTGYCARRRQGILTDGLCARTCGMCVPSYANVQIPCFDNKDNELDSCAVASATSTTPNHLFLATGASPAIKSPNHTQHRHRTTLQIPLQATKASRRGCLDCAMWVSGSNGGVVFISGVLHWAWAGSYLYINLGPDVTLTDWNNAIGPHETLWFSRDPPPTLSPTQSPSPTTPDNFGGTVPPAISSTIPSGFQLMGSGWCWGVGRGEFSHATDIADCADRCQHAQLSLHNDKAICESFVWRQPGQCWLYREQAKGASEAVQSGSCFRRARPSNVVLTQRDFENGTYIISNPGVYTLGSDIEFLLHDGSTVTDPARFLFPSTAQVTEGGPYSSKAYALGFFAAIVIASDNVVLDLGGFTLKQSKAHSLVQRFFSLIELASSPFPASAGPADFGDYVVAANHVVIRNGRLGRSAHHGIHGNGNSDITLENLIIEDFEVAGVSCNAIRQLSMHRVTIERSRADVPVNGRFSAAINLLRLVDINLGEKAATDFLPLKTALTALRRSVATTINQVIHRSKFGLDNKLFQTETGGLPDGSLLSGIIVHPTLNVGDYWTGETGSDDLDFKDVKVSDLAGNPAELTVLILSSDPTGSSGTKTDYTGAHVRDNLGSVLDIDRIVSADGRYIPNELADMQFALASYKFHCKKPGNICASKELVDRSNIPLPVVNWAYGTNDTAWADILAEGYTLRGGNDFMFHRNKGVVAVKIDGTVNADLRGISVSDIENYADKSRRSKHVSIDGYRGQNVRAVALAADTNIIGSVGGVSGLYAAVPGEARLLEHATPCFDIDLDVIPGNANPVITRQL